MGAYTTDEFTKILLHMEETTLGDLEFIDSSGNGNDFTRVGETRPSSIQKRFGATSCKFDGGATSQYGSGLIGRIPDLDHLRFTVDFWFYLPSNPSLLHPEMFSLLSMINSELSYPYKSPDLWVGARENYFTIYFVSSSGERKYLCYNSSAIKLNTWIHLAIVRDEYTFIIYINGKYFINVRFPYSLGTNPIGVCIGTADGYLTNNQDLSGFIDEFRISSNILRWITDFDPLTSYINASAGSNGIINPSGNISVSYDTSKTFTITPNATYAVSSVLVDGLLVGTPSTYTFGNVDSDHTISAAFDNNIRTITSSAGLNGSISPSGSVPVTIGQSKTFTFTPNAGYEIEAVMVDGVSQGVINTYTFTNVQAVHTISVTFKLFNSYLITASASTGGTITPSGSVAAIKGSNKTFTIAANTGYQLVDVSVDSVSVGAVLTYTFTNVQAEHTISATFSITTYEIISTAGTGGTIVPLGTTTVNSGSNQGYVITPDEDYIIQDVYIDGVVVELPASGTLFITD